MTQEAHHGVTLTHVAWVAGPLINLNDNPPFGCWLQLLPGTGAPSREEACDRAMTCSSIVIIDDRIFNGDTVCFVHDHDGGDVCESSRSSPRVGPPPTCCREAGGISRLLDMACTPLSPTAASLHALRTAGTDCSALPASPAAIAAATLTPLSAVSILGALALDPANKVVIGAAGGVAVLLETMQAAPPKSQVRVCDVCACVVCDPRCVCRYC